MGRRNQISVDKIMKDVLNTESGLEVTIDDKKLSEVRTFYVHIKELVAT